MIRVLSLLIVILLPVTSSSAGEAEFDHITRNLPLSCDALFKGTVVRKVEQASNLATVTRSPLTSISVVKESVFFSETPTRNYTMHQSPRPWIVQAVNVEVLDMFYYFQPEGSAYRGSFRIDFEIGDTMIWCVSHKLSTGKKEPKGYEWFFNQAFSDNLEDKIRKMIKEKRIHSK